MKETSFIIIFPSSFSKKIFMTLVLLLISICLLFYQFLLYFFNLEKFYQLLDSDIFNVNMTNINTKYEIYY